MCKFELGESQHQHTLTINYKALTTSAEHDVHMYTLATQVHLWTFITSTLAERTRDKWTEKTRQKQSFLNVCCCGKLSRRGKRRKNGMIRNTHIYAKKILRVPVNSLEDKSKVALVIQIKQETRNEYSEPFLILLNATILQQSSSHSWHFSP